MPDLLLHNAGVWTMDAARPRAEALAVRAGCIVAVGSLAEAANAVRPDATRIDCAGGVLLPGFIDAHCHLLAYAASLRSVDCTGARSIGEIQQAIRHRAQATAPGSWVRAFGYEETSLAERRHPDRRDLDAAAPAHPVRLLHRSGHASVLNSAALRLAGIDIATEEPPGAAMERDLTTGEPNGLLIEMEEIIDRALPPLPREELVAGVREAAGRMVRAGITCAQDASPTNGRPQWDLFEELFACGALPFDVVLMEGIDRLGELPERGAGGRLRRGAVKVMLREVGDDLCPDQAELTRIVTEVHASGRQVAVHAVSARAVAAAASAIEAALRAQPRAGHRHRIEHCSRLPDGPATGSGQALAERLAALGIVVVSQPSFVRERGDRYLELLPPEALPSLYAFRTLQDAGVALAAGSDAPVTPPAPLASAAAALDRLAASGQAVAPEQAVELDTALRWWTAGAAFAGFLESERGAIRPGLRADLLLLAPGALDRGPAALRSAAAARVWLGGREALPSADRGVDREAGA